jgi:hypothetical protein
LVANEEIKQPSIKERKRGEKHFDQQSKQQVLALKEET